MILVTCLHLLKTSKLKRVLERARKVSGLSTFRKLRPEQNTRARAFAQSPRGTPITAMHGGSSNRTVSPFHEVGDAGISTAFHVVTSCSVRSQNLFLVEHHFAESSFLQLPSNSANRIVVIGVQLFRSSSFVQSHRTDWRPFVQLPSICRITS